MTRPPTEVGERTYKTWRTCPTFRTTPRSVSTFFKRRERSTAPTQSNDDGSGSPKHSDKGFHSFQRTNSVALRFPRLVATPPNSTDGCGHSSDDAPPQSNVHLWYDDGFRQQICDDRNDKVSTSADSLRVLRQWSRRRRRLPQTRPPSSTSKQRTGNIRGQLPENPTPPAGQDNLPPSSLNGGQSRARRRGKPVARPTDQPATSVPGPKKY